MDSIYLQLNRYIQPIIIVFGTIGALLNQVLFYYRKSLRSTSCALYFRALSLNDLFVIWFVIFLQWLQEQFQIDPTTEYEWYCKLSTYLNYVFYTLSPYFIVLACFDRLCTSSTNIRIRKIATIRIASFLIPCIIILPFIIYSYVPMSCKLISFPNNSFCAIIDPRMARILALFLLLFYCLIPPSLMIIFCSITFILLRQQRHRIMPINQARLRHRDNQLLKMLFIYVTTNIVCIVPFTVTYFLQMYDSDNFSSVANSLAKIFTLLIHVTYATSFYIYTLGTPFYRDELYHLIQNIRHRFHRNNNMIINRQARRITKATGT